MATPIDEEREKPEAEEEAEQRSRGRRTVFVENLPFSSTSDQLETLFGEFGPISRCFVVADKNNQGCCKGVGFVTFASADDAFSALKKPVRHGGRRLLLSLADRLTKSKGTKRKSLDNKDDPTNDSLAAFEKESGFVKESKTTNKAEKTSKAAAVRTVVVRAVKSENEITKIAGNPKRIRNLIFDLDAGGKKYALILYCGKRDALVAVRRFLRLKMDANLLSANREKSNRKSEANSKKCRLIVRNLPFGCEDDYLQEAFSEFGEIVEVNIPKRENGKKLGFGMVQFKTIEAASRAVKEMNGKSILGRPVAVDWTLPKSKYVNIRRQAESKKDTKNKRKIGAEGTGKQGCVDKLDEEEYDEDKESLNSDEEEDEDVDKMDVSLKLNPDSSDEDFDSYVSTHDEEDEKVEEEEEESDDAITDGDDHEIRKDDDDDDCEDEFNSESNKNEIASKRHKELKPDVDEGRTVFIRNLSFDSMEDDLKELMNERFGDIKYCRIVMDKSMQHSKGTAFVQFKTKKQAEECIRMASSFPEDLVLDDRKLVVSLALPRQAANDLKTPQNKEKVDKRNLHLIRVGLIRPGTQEASGLSAADLQKRMKVEAVTRQKLKNPNIFVSSTRLCVRNIPVSVEDHSLLKTFLKASGNPKTKITECRIMRDLQRVGSNGLGKSRGYGFINFESHEDALTALTTTNNNPEIYGEKRRLIVEFSLENKAALLAKQRRTEKSQAKCSKKTNISQKKKGSNRFQPDIIAPTGNQKKGLPSHWGPKIRHKARPELKKARNQKSSISDKHAMPASKKKKKNRKNLTEITDNLDRLIENYKIKFSNF